MRLRLLLIPILLLTTQACLSSPTPREGTRPLRSGEETAKSAQEDTLKDLDASAPSNLVLYSTSADARSTTPSKAKTAPQADPQPPATTPQAPSNTEEEDETTPSTTEAAPAQTTTP